MAYSFLLFFFAFAEVLKELLQSFPAPALETTDIQSHIDIVNLLLKVDDNQDRILRAEIRSIVVRGAFANIRIVNKLLKGEVGPKTIHVPSGEKLYVFDAAMVCDCLLFMLSENFLYSSTFGVIELLSKTIPILASLHIKIFLNFLA